jgi:hypothetical protein
VGALAARLMTIPLDASPRELRWAQEDAWADGRVQRRWAQFAVQLSAAERNGTAAARSWPPAAWPAPR